MDTSHWENWITEEHYFYIVSNTAYILHQLCMLLYIMSQKKRKQTILNITTHFIVGRVAQSI
jgi:hypothetical protein